MAVSCDSNVKPDAKNTKHEVPNQSAFLKEIHTLLKQDGKALIVEPRFHVSKKDFYYSMELLKNIGFGIVDEPKIVFSRSVLIERKILP